jgi:3-oxoacyl-[acyl-carrier protein] reductase
MSRCVEHVYRCLTDTNGLAVINPCIDNFARETFSVASKGFDGAFYDCFEPFVYESRRCCVLTDRLFKRIEVAGESFTHADRCVNHRVRRFDNCRDLSDVVDVGMGENKVLDISEFVSVRVERLTQAVLAVQTGHPGVDQHRLVATDEIAGNVTRRPIDIVFDAIDRDSRPALIYTHYHYNPRRENKIDVRCRKQLYYTETELFRSIPPQLLMIIRMNHYGRLKRGDRDMTTDQFSVDGKTVLITGSSQGIGKVTAERFAADGANVVVSSRSQEKIDDVVAGIEAENPPGEALAVECDVRERDAVEALVEATVEEFGSLDVLVNNAGASFMANFEGISENGWKTIVDINLHGTYHCSQVAGEYMREQGGGNIVNFASVAGIEGAPYMSHYAAAKAGVVNLTRTLAFEWADDDVRVNCIAPGFVATPGVESQMGVTADEIDRETVDRRIGLSEEIADIVQFLATPASSYIDGQTITASGVPDIMETPET